MRPPFVRRFPSSVAPEDVHADPASQFWRVANAPVTAMPRLLPALAALLVLAQACSHRAARNLAYDESARAEDYPFAYADTTGDAYLRELRQRHGLDSVTASSKTDLERVLAVLHWTHTQWSHDGYNTPTASDALSILEEAAGGASFRCVEYGIVSSEALQAIGIPARTIGLKIAAVETRWLGAGHVAAEAYLRDMGKWVFLDGQFGVVPTLDGVPLNAVEFGEALRTRRDDVALVSAEGPVTGKPRAQYLRFVDAYLYYLDVRFDNRPVASRDERVRVGGKSSLMLVPAGAARPTVFQRKSPMDYLAYTSSPPAFYAVPAQL